MYNVEEKKYIYTKNTESQYFTGQVRYGLAAPTVPGGGVSGQPGNPPGCATALSAWVAESGAFPR